MGLVILEATHASATWLMDHDFLFASSSMRWTILLSDCLNFFSNGLPTVALDLSVSVPTGRARSPVSSGEYAMTPMPLYAQYGSSSSSYRGSEFGQWLGRGHHVNDARPTGLR